MHFVMSDLKTMAFPSRLVSAPLNSHCSPLVLVNLHFYHPPWKLPVETEEECLTLATQLTAT
jgi:hypothetical protein